MDSAQLFLNLGPFFRRPVQERNGLSQHQLDVERLRTVRAAADRELAVVRLTVDQFEDASRELVEAVEAEVPVVVYYHHAYLPELQSYR